MMGVTPCGRCMALLTVATALLVGVPARCFADPTKTVPADSSLYLAEIHTDEPLCFLEFDDAESDEGSIAHNSARGDLVGPAGVYAKTVRRESGQSAVARRAALLGGAEYVEIPHDAVFDTREISVEFWFRSTQKWNQKYWPGSATLVSKFTTGWASSDWGILGGSLTSGVDEGRILVGVGPQGGGDVVLASGTGLNDGRFHHVVWTRTREGLNTLYVDGTSCASVQDRGGKITNSRPIQVGGEQYEPQGTYFRGSLAAVAIYPRVLTEERVRIHHAVGTLDPRLPPSASRTVDFVRDIRPIFQKHCHACHGPGKDRGGLSLARKELALDGGDSGRVILPGQSAVSPLISRVAGLDEATVMPPEGDRLTAEQVGLIRAWIDQGATWPADADEPDPRVAQGADHWAFQPLRRPALPALIHTTNSSWIRSPVDVFVLDKLESRELQPGPPAAKSALLRRVTFDLTGLPPTPQALEAFELDSSPEAFATVVDRLLASPAYGERWGRHWLDVVRYADSGGFETDILYQQAWRYRDYVIRSLNDDLPYDRFLMEQVAGDELWPEQSESMRDAIAVWTLGQWPNALDKFPEMLESARRVDQVTTLGESMLGLTVGCANCHKHKYDPISQRDYFGLEAIFAASETWDLTTGKKAWASGEREHFRILRHAPTPTVIRLLARGELSKPRGLVSPALPAFLPGGGMLPGGPLENHNRRAHLARWVASRDNPLTARVIANRVWQWHFGRALASTPNDLGTRGHPPSHPELLDWLASELVDGGWSLKHLHRVILLSATYQQTTRREDHAVEIDPQNIWLAGFPRRRLEAEEVWDHLHATAGVLQATWFGTPFVPPLSDEELQGLYDIEQKPDKKWPVTEEQNRRAIYILNRRSFRFPFFEAFDPPSNGVSCPVRQATTVPSQALTLLNNQTVSRLASAMSDRLIREAGDEPVRWIRLAWLLAYSREIDDDELPLATRFLADSEAAHRALGSADPQRTARVEFCLALMNTSEFIDAH